MFVDAKLVDAFPIYLKTMLIKPTRKTIWRAFHYKILSNKYGTYKAKGAFQPLLHLYKDN